MIVASVIFYVIDAWLFARCFYPAAVAGADVIRNYWIVMPLLTGLFAFCMALGVWFGDFSPHINRSKEDIFGTLLLFFTPFILIWSGTLDIWSASMIDWFNTGIFAAGWNIWWTWDWWWLNDPWNLGFGWTLPSWFARLCGLSTLPFIFVVIGAILGPFIVAALWMVYWKHT